MSDRNKRHKESAFRKIGKS